MKNISEFFNVLKFKIDSHKQLQIFFSESVEECLNIKIPPENFLFKNSTVFIKCDSVIKNEIILNKKNIINIFNKKNTSNEKILKVF